MTRKESRYTEKRGPANLFCKEIVYKISSVKNILLKKNSGNYFYKNIRILTISDGEESAATTQFRLRIVKAAKGHTHGRVCVPIKLYL